MAAPTPTTTEENVGHGGITVYKVVWTAGAADNLSDAIVVNLSDQEYTNNLKIRRITVAGTSSITATFEFDDDSADELVAFFPQGTGGPMVFDYREAPHGGLVRTGSGGTGDLVITTTDAADGQELSAVIEWRVD